VLTQYVNVWACQEGSKIVICQVNVLTQYVNVWACQEGSKIVIGQVITT